MRGGLVLVMLLMACSPFSGTEEPPRTEPAPGGTDAGAADARATVADCGGACAASMFCDEGACVTSLCASSDRTIRLHPTGHSEVDPNLTVVPAGTSYAAAVGESGAAVDTTYISARSTSKLTAHFTKPALALPAGAAITRVVVGARVRRGADAPPADSGIRIGLHFTDRRSPLDPDWNSGTAGRSTTYTIEISSFPEYPAWDASEVPHPWTVTDVDNLELRAQFDPKSATNPVELSQLWLDVCFAGP